MKNDYHYRDGWVKEWIWKTPKEKASTRFFEPIFRCTCGSQRHITSTVCIVCSKLDKGK